MADGKADPKPVVADPKRDDPIPSRLLLSPAPRKTVALEEMARENPPCGLLISRKIQLLPRTIYRYLSSGCTPSLPMARLDFLLDRGKSAMIARGCFSCQLRPREQHQVALAEQVPVPPLKGNTSDGRKDGKDARVSRSSSYSDVEAPEASFIDTLKGTSRKNASETESSAGPAESLDGGRSGNKKKGKKGRQIDPSLLGFKVHSNRTLMGEIQHPED